jgi:transcriptional regulator GlxA family with amidase domain
MTLHIGFLGFDQANALDLAGPMEAFATARSLLSAATSPGYELHLIGLTDAAFACESGLAMLPKCSIDSPPPLDTLIVPGGAGLRRPDTNEAVAAWLGRTAPAIRRVATVCTGIYGLAPTGLLDGRRVTTHWRFARDVAQQFPRLQVQDDAIYLRDGPYYTSAGITAGIDLALALIEEDCGRSTALAVARDLVVYLQRAGGQAQYSEPLQLQARSGDRFAELISWMLANVSRDLSVETLAARVCLSPRHFSRRFAAELGQSPADFVTELRINAARRLLDQGGLTLERLAAAVGFRSSDVFRRAFERKFGLSPSAYRLGFGASTTASITTNVSEVQS